MRMTSMRVYGGVAGDERLAERRAQLLAAGLDLLASDDGVRAFTVRGVCREAGLASRYFYESFPDAGSLAAVLFDATVDGLTTAALTALDEADTTDTAALARIGVDAIVGHIVEDPRRGRLLFSPALAALPVIAERRSSSTRLFVGLLGDQALGRRHVGTDSAPDVATEMLVGGLAQAVSAWLNGDIVMDRESFVDRCAELFVDVLSRAGARGD
jgi:AcrR family transcriptional regulator